MRRSSRLRDESTAESADEVAWTAAAQRRKRSSTRRDPNAPRPKKGYFEIATVEGEFLDFDGNYRFALSAVDDLEKAMVESGKYFSVEITKRPLDIESDNRLSGNVGAGGGTQQRRAELGFRVVREVML